MADFFLNNQPDSLIIQIYSVTKLYEGQSVSFRIEFFVLVWSLVTTPAARGIIPKVSLASVLKASFLCALCVT